MIPRTRRSQRRSVPAPLRVTDRDLAVLEALGRMKFAATRHLALLAFAGSRWAAQKRLRRLLDAGLVRAWVPRLDGENIYTLAPRGVRLLEVPTADGFQWPIPRGLDGRLDHLLAINDVRLALALGIERGGGQLLWWRSDWELRGRFRERLVPDAVFAVRWTPTERVFALEVDNASRSQKGFLRKVVQYTAIEARAGGLCGVSEFRSLFVGRDPLWLERYRLAARESRCTWLVWFATLESLERGIDRRIWIAPDGSALSLRELVFLPYRKEGLAAESASAYGTLPSSVGSDIPR